MIIRLVRCQNNFMRIPLSWLCILLLLSLVLPLRLKVSYLEIYTFDFALLAFFIGIRLAKKRFFLFFEYDVFLVLFIFTGLISSILSTNPLDSFFSGFAIFRSMLIVFIGRMVALSDSGTKSVIKFIVFIVMVESLVALVQYYTTSYFGSPSNYLGLESEIRIEGSDEIQLFRVRGTFGYDTNLGMFYIFAIPICMAVLLKTNNKYILIVLILSAIGLFLTFTRSAWISVFFSVLIMILLMVSSRYYSINKFLFLLGLGFLFALALSTNDAFMDMFIERVYGEKAGDSLIIRAALNLAAFKIIENNPFFGIGFGNFGHYLIYDFGLVGLTTDIIKAHNVFIAMLSEAGGVSFTFFLLWLFSSGFGKIRYYQYLNFGYIVTFSICLGILLQNQLAWTMLQPGVAGLFWGALGFMQMKSCFIKKRG